MKQHNIDIRLQRLGFPIAHLRARADRIKDKIKKKEKPVYDKERT